jgi:hypothetical protein
MGITAVLPVGKKNSKKTFGYLERKAELITIGDRGRKFVFKIRAKPILIGRANSMDQEMFGKHLSLGPVFDTETNASYDRVIVPDIDPTKNISSYGHAKIIWKLIPGRRLWALELQDTSTNGTIVNGEKLNKRKKVLLDKSHIEIGIYKFELLY